MTCLGSNQKVGEHLGVLQELNEQDGSPEDDKLYAVEQVPYVPQKSFCTTE
jgi:hypothetical protein